jgi:hypothetical protein
MAGTAQPLSARISIATAGQRARNARTSTRSTPITPRLAWALPGRSSVVITWLVSPSKTSSGWYICCS